MKTAYTALSGRSASAPAAGLASSPTTLSPVVIQAPSQESTADASAGPSRDRSETADSDSSVDQGSYQPIDLVRIVIPVFACIMFVVFMTILTTPSKELAVDKPYMALTPFHSKDADLSTAAWQTAANVGILIGVIVVLTFVILGFYLCYCYKLLYVIAAVPVVMVNLVFTWLYLHKFCAAMNIPVDHITAGLMTLNFGAVGCLSILGRAPKILQQIYLLYLCSVMAIVYIQFMPTWTVWLFLGALAIWDLIAVLTPCGPLRILVETIQEREHNFVPAMVYSTIVYIMAEGNEAKKPFTSTTKVKKAKPTKDEKKKDEKTDGKESADEPKRKEKHRLRLGLGDFVFYSLLTGKAAEQCLSKLEVVDWTILMACIIAVLTGLLATIILLILFKKALPALPISIALGLVFYFSGVYVISPFCELMALNQVFI